MSTIVRTESARALGSILISPLLECTSTPIVVPTACARMFFSVTFPRMTSPVGLRTSIT